jgi:hypothetical protein
VRIVRRRWTSGLGFEVDALSRAVLRSINRRALQAGGYDDRSPWIGEHDITIVDVADAIVEYDEQIWAAVDTQPCARATVLVDPHSHQQPRSSTISVFVAPALRNGSSRRSIQILLKSESEPPFDETPRALWQFALPGEPDLDRIIRFQPTGTALRLHCAPSIEIGVRVGDATIDGEPIHKGIASTIILK